jgi:hypothetical protein
VSEFRKGSFVAGWKNDRVKYIVKAKGEEESSAQLVETGGRRDKVTKIQRESGKLDLV